MTNTRHRETGRDFLARTTGQILIGLVVLALLLMAVAAGKFGKDLHDRNQPAWQTSTRNPAVICVMRGGVPIYNNVDRVTDCRFPPAQVK